MHKFITIFLIIFYVALHSESGFKFLRSERTPLIISTAQTSWLYSSSPSHSDINPSSFKGGETAASELSYRMLDDDTSISELSAGYSDKSSLYGMKISYFNIEGIEGREVPSESPLYDFGSRNMIISVNYNYIFSKVWSAGFSGKYLYQKIEFEDSKGFAGSAGIFGKNIFIKGLNSGISVNNIGKMDELDKTSSDLPSDIVFGTGYIFRAGGDIFVRTGISLRYLLNDSEVENYAGTELSYSDRMFLRAGYRFNNEGMPFSAGLGFAFDHFRFDYSMTPFNEEVIDMSHAVSVIYNLKRENK